MSEAWRARISGDHATYRAKMEELFKGVKLPFSSPKLPQSEK